MAPSPFLPALIDGWAAYQQHLVRALAPLSADQLALRPGPTLRSVGENARHLVRARASWFFHALGEGDDAIAAIADWEAPGAPLRTAAELVGGLETTWQLIASCLRRWDAATLAAPFERTWRGETYTLTRQWIIWHLLEHDLHHGGEISLTLGMHGLPGLAL
jgi:uncharacterized damage-inducible protein DinB